MKKGDKVRFLHEIGGGTVSGFRGKNIVLVEDEDGFEIPMLMTDVVVVGNEDYSTGHVVKAKIATQSAVEANYEEGGTRKEEGETPEPKVTFRRPVEERKGGNLLSAYIAFVPIDIKEVSQTRFEAYFVNDSNYYLQYSYMVVENNSWTVRSQGEIEPNTKEFIEEFGREDLNQMDRIGVQFIAYKREKPFAMKSPVDVQIRIDSVKFYKLHTFQDNDFFEQKALIYTIIENDVTR